MWRGGYRLLLREANKNHDYPSIFITPQSTALRAVKGSEIEMRERDLFARVVESG
jgi:hypothetical protein